MSTIKITLYEKINNYKLNLFYIRVLSLKVFYYLRNIISKISYFKIYIYSTKLVDYEGDGSIY